MAAKDVAVDANRLWADLMALAEITDPRLPYTRRSFSPLFFEGRRWLAEKFAEAGLTVRTDPAGNLIGQLPGKLPALGVIAVGSHSDTVPSGGRFDGIAGVVNGLEIVRALRDAHVRLDHTIEVIDFLAEEPSEYGLSCIGSRGMSGALEPRMLDMTNSVGETLRDGLRRVGGDPDHLDAARRSDIEAFIELHIEQGIVLESQSLDVGIVTAIVGIRRIEIVFVGEADHAGTTPMALRHDALVAGTRTVAAVRRIAEQMAQEEQDYFVATVGVLTIEPGAANVVPSKCRMVIDARTTNRALIERFTQIIERESGQHAADARVSRAPLAILSDGPPASCDPTLRAVMEQSARELDLTTLDIASGAGHDTAFMTRVCPSGMVFVPCRQGKSHSPEEWADADAIAAGAAVVLQSVKTLDRSLPRKS
ncbi:MAG TPA: Zn-dependent hydrolase [Xanthobacteraceae bacterium]|nr:Zn-dependent hydrolase [Xanthobacteraceae bacterium]